MPLKHVVGPLAVVNMAPEERHDSSARSDAIGPLARVRAHEFKGLAVESPAGAAAAADVSVSVSNVLPGVAIGAGAFKAGHLVAAGWWLGLGRNRAAKQELVSIGNNVMADSAAAWRSHHWTHVSAARRARIIADGR